MKLSLRTKLTLIFCVLSTTGMLISWFVNVAFLERFYTEKKIEDLVYIYNQVSSSFLDDGHISVEKREDLFSLCETKNVSLIVVDYSLHVQFLAGYDLDDTSLQKRVGDIMFEEGEDAERVIIENDEYTVQIVNDDENEVEYIEMWGDMSNGNVYVMRSNVDSIKQVVKVANDFYVNVVLLVLLLSIVITIIITINTTKPILDLVHISERMSNLEFDVKYKTKSNDELAVLGNSMNKLSEKLESTISELKAANLELQKDIEEKNEIDKMRKEFVSNVSHELKTPIALIQGYAEGLKEGVIEDEESKAFYCDVIIDEANKMNKMVMKLITLNQIESGNSKIEMERFDIITLIDTVLNSASILLKEKGANVFFDNTKSVFVWTDEFQIQEIITNYLSNAINHLDGDKNIKITTILHEKTVRINVYNSGAHIPEEDIDKIWDKFYKVDKARTREYGGSGIGLSIVKAICESLNMQCGVQNVEDGVEFYIEMEREVT
ncbi:MAG: two-component sensor histidine kinase [Lachnospiraceae bacterium]|nr:two-component sensor histidine kinase [Lachnospiraceae bacterium]